MPARPGYPIRALATATGVVSLFVAGLISERLRPFGTEFHRKSSINLARQIAAMELARCCHDCG